MVTIYIAKKSLKLPLYILKEEKFNELSGQFESLLKSQVPTLIVAIYGVFLLALIVFICLLLKSDMGKLQDSLSSKFGIENLFMRINVANFDNHFNRYMEKSIDYIKNNTNLTLPELPRDPETNQTRMFDLAQFVHQVINDPMDARRAEIPEAWNASLM